ncbi:hypothetical protein [Pseudonocardia humida]|uniref:Secreted protein n=1 Tax=Pseudonocardia humida TaxID=2800819 RepID=A0ABT1ACR2_9PSEU|nr:hypothetical protein [Pseudonocardia humida]MCO1660793.1 hypothetical protein [Pseudonocardia humida]
MIRQSAYRPARPVRTTVAGSVLVMVVARSPVGLLSGNRFAARAPRPRRWKSLMPWPSSVEVGRRRDDLVPSAWFRIGDNHRNRPVPTQGKDQTMLVGRHVEHEAAD